MSDENRDLFRKDAGDDAGALPPRAKRSTAQRGGPTPPAPKKERPLQWETVPRRSEGRRCKGATCGAWVYWIERPSTAKNAPPGKLVKVPVHCDLTGGRRPTADADGFGVNHFGNCPDASRF